MKYVFVLIFSLLGFIAFTQNDFLINPVVATSGYLTRPAVADIDGDGDLDMLFSSSQPSILAWAENIDGAGTYGEPIIIQEIEERKAVAAGDLDNDGDIDIVSILDTYYGGIRLYWFENLDGLGNFSEPIDISYIGDDVREISLFDADQDGYLDIFAARRHEWQESSIFLFLNTGVGTFYINGPTGGPVYPYVSLLDNYYLSDFDHADINRDGIMDLVSVIYDGTLRSRVSWHPGGFDGDELYYGPAERIFSITNQMFNSVTLVDIDLDGDLDACIGSSDKILRPVNIRWIENMDGEGLFDTEHVISEDLGTNVLLHSADLDNDGDFDLISSSRDNIVDNNIAWWENIDGQGTFIRNFISDKYVGISSIFTEDIDSDGALDIISTSISFINWFKNPSVGKNQIAGQTKLDVNQDDCASSTKILPNQLVSTTDGIDTISTFSTVTNGSYNFKLLEGNYTSFTNLNSQLLEVTPSSVNSDFLGLGNIDKIDFCYSVKEELSDLSVVLIPQTEARLGFESNYLLVFENKGTNTLDGKIKLFFDETKIKFLDSSEIPTEQSNNHLEFDFANLELLESRKIKLAMEVFLPPAVFPNDSLIFEVNIDPLLGDINEEDNQFTLKQLVVGSYDPNDIAVLEGDEISIEETENFLHYMIRFQNTGNADAINVRVENQIDKNLDWRSLEIIDLSHDYKVNISEDKIITFSFDNIYLPDSTSNLAASQGHIAYRIKPILGIQVGESILNDAKIYFDLNPAIETNIVKTTVQSDILGFDDLELINQMIIFPNPNNGSFQLDAKTLEFDNLTIRNTKGRIVFRKFLDGKNPSQKLETGLGPGIYFIELEAENQQIVKKIVIH